MVLCRPKQGLARRIALYIRVSTEEQTLRPEGSPKNQELALVAWVEEQNRRTPGFGIIVDIYRDLGESAKNLRRPGMQILLGDVKDGKIDLVIFTELSRFLRSSADLHYILGLFEQYKTSFLATTQDIDFSTSYGKAFLSILASMAQLERDQTADRNRFSSYNRAIRGLRTGGLVPYGYKKAEGQSGHLAIDPAEATGAERIFDIFLNIGGCLKKTAELANEAGLFGDRPWNAQSLRTWINSAALAGEREVNPRHKGLDPSTLKDHEQYRKVKSPWPPLGQARKREEAKALLSSNYRKPKGQKRVPLLSRLLFCCEGNGLTGATTSKKGGEKRYPYYRHEALCARHSCSVRADKLEQAVLHQIWPRLKHPEVARQLAAQANLVFGPGRADAKRQIGAMKRKVNDIDAKRKKALDLALAAPSEDERRQWVGEANELETKKARYQEDIWSLEEQEAENFREFTAADLVEAVERLEAEFKGLPDATKSRLIQALIDRIVLYENHYEIAFKHSDLLSNPQPSAIPT